MARKQRGTREPAQRRRAELLARLGFQLQIARLRLDRVVGRLLRPGRARVAATACWQFPVYSQTFVYQELTQLIRGGFDVRFFYGELSPTDQLPPQFLPLWRARRRLQFHPAVCEDSYAYFARHTPDRLEGLIAALGRASGLSSERLLEHYHVRQAFAFARMVEAFRPHYVHSYFFYEGTLFGLVASWLLAVPRGVSCYADHMLQDYDMKALGLHLTQCSLMIATSHRIADELVGIEPTLGRERIVVKPNGINSAHFPVVVRPSPGPGEAFRLVSVCRIEPKKGLVYLVEALARLRDRGLRVELHVIGGVDDNERSRACANELSARIEALQLAEAVHLEGRRTEAEINARFSRSHLFVAPFIETDAGDKDGVPTALLEGMASGLPVVATTAGSIQEVVEHGRDGIIVAQRDANALADAIAGLMVDEAARTRLGAAAAAKVRASFDATTGERVFHEYLTRLLAEAPNTPSLMEKARP